MIGRKVTTYSRLRPFGGSASKTEETKATDKPSNGEDKSERSYEERLLSSISASIRKLDIDLTMPMTKSRKSEIRPRLSIAPSKEEFTDLLSCCRQDDELSFIEWLEETKLNWPMCSKIGESSFSEVFKMTCSAGDESIAVKIMPLLRPEDGLDAKGSERSPEPIQLDHLLHEIRSLQVLESLRMERKYAIPSGHTGFNRMVK